MDEDYILRLLVGSYNPEDATLLPFKEQQGIIREITGWTVTNPEATLAYLQTQEESALVDDPVIASLMRQRLEAGMVIADNEDLKDYITNNDDAIFARYQENWPYLQQKYNREEWLQLLLHTGTTAASEVYEQAVGEENITLEEYKSMYLASLTTRDFQTLELLDAIGLAFGYDNDDMTMNARELSPRQVRNAVRYDRQLQQPFFRITKYLTLIYYQEEEVAAFLYYFSLLEKEERTKEIGELYGALTMDFNEDNPVFQAYLQQFPADRAVREFKREGVAALEQIHDLLQA